MQMNFLIGLRRAWNNSSSLRRISGQGSGNKQTIVTTLAWCSVWSLSDSHAETSNLGPKCPLGRARQVLKYSGLFGVKPMLSLLRDLVRRRWVR